VNQQKANLPNDFDNSDGISRWPGVCYGLAYASQQESLHHRGLGKAQKIRMQLGGSANMFDAFPDKPRGMHWRTYNCLRRAPDIDEEHSNIGLMRFAQRHKTLGGTSDF
jgi:hypothetical protein